MFAAHKYNYDRYGLLRSFHDVASNGQLTSWNLIITLFSICFSFFYKKIQDGREITRNVIAYFYDWPLRIKTAEDMLPYMFAAYKYNEKP